MKKFALLFLFFLCIRCFAQDATPAIKQKTKTPYLVAGVSFSQTKDTAMSAEGGILGINGSLTTYALTFDGTVPFFPRPVVCLAEIVKSRYV